MTSVNEKSTVKPNRFLRIVKAVFISDLLLKFASAFCTAVLWCLFVGLSSKGEGDFLSSFLNNILNRFATPYEITISVIDVVLLFFLTYAVAYFVRKSNALPILKFLFLAIVFIIVMSCGYFDFPVMGSVFGGGMVIVFLAVVIMYPQELRRLLVKLASRTEVGEFNVDFDCSDEELRNASGEIVKAVLDMSKNNCGALIILTNKDVPQHLLESGTALHATLSRPLIECLFNTGADLHDGAVFIHGNQILSAGCFLPLSQSQSLPKELGTRHRAALGVSEQYDVVVIVVSEETGVISVARDGKLERYYDAVMLTEVIEQCYGLKAKGDKKRRKPKK